MRHEDWPERMADKLREWRAKPFEWGLADCVIFVADMVQAMTGCDLAEKVRGRYASEFGARRQILEHGGDLAELLTRKLGAPVAVNFAQRGDIVMSGGNLGICVGPSGAFVTPAGLIYIDLADCSACWKVD